MTVMFIKKIDILMVKFWLIFFTGFSLAQTEYPIKPIRIVCVHASGGSADTLTRALADQLPQYLGQPVIVENKPGASTMLGAMSVARSPFDGYTLLMASVTTLSINPSLYKKINYDVLNDFAPVVMVAQTPSVLAVSPKLPVSNVQELIDLLKKNPDKFNFSSPGDGTSPHLAGVLFANEAHVKIVHIPFKNSAEPITSLISGEIQLTFENSLVPFSRTGVLKPLGIGSLKRSSSWPDLPTIAEQGLPNYESIVWYGLVAPAHTPQQIINKLNDAVNKALGSAQMIQVIHLLSGDPVGGSPENFANLIEADRVKWAGVIQMAGITKK